MGEGAAPPPPGAEGEAAGPPTPRSPPPAAAGVVLVLIDGVGDVGGPAVAGDGGGALPPGATPLQAAATPVLDAIAGV